MTATVAERRGAAPDRTMGEGWTFERKLDGYRCLAWVDGPDVITWFRLKTTVADAELPVVNWSHVEDGRITAIKVTFDPRPLGA